MTFRLRETRTDRCPPDLVSPGWKIELASGKRSVSRLWIVERRMRVGDAVLRVGGISTVGTDPEFRGQGLAARVLEAALRKMEAEGFDASLLHGIPDFYHRFGYACCIPEYSLKIPRQNLRGAARAAEASRVESGLRLRRLRPGDLSAVLRMHQAGNGDRTGSVLRPRGWRGFPRGAGFFEKPSPWAAVDARRQVRGYFVCDAKNPGRISEVGGDARAYPALVEFLASRAGREAELILPPDHPFAVHCRDFGCEGRITFPKNGGFMGRILGLNSCLAKVAQALGSGGAPEGVLSLTTDLGFGSLEIRRGTGNYLPGKTSANGAADLSQSVLWQFMMGYRSASELAAGGGLRASPSQIGLLENWFPLRLGNMDWADRF